MNHIPNTFRQVSGLTRFLTQEKRGPGFSREDPVKRVMGPLAACSAGIRQSTARGLQTWGRSYLVVCQGLSKLFADSEMFLSQKNRGMSSS